MCFLAVAIGLVMSVFAAMRILGPPLYAHWADASGRPLGLLRAALVVAAGCALAFQWVQGLLGIVVVLAVYSALWNGVMSIYDAHVLGRLGSDAARYGRLRLWGSIGFIAASMAAGPGLERAGIELLPWAWAALVGLTWLSILGLGPGATVAVARTDDSDAGTAVSEANSDSTATASLPAGPEQPVSHQAALRAARPAIRRNVLRWIFSADIFCDVFFMSFYTLQGGFDSPLIQPLGLRQALALWIAQCGTEMVCRRLRLGLCDRRERMLLTGPRREVTSRCAAADPLAGVNSLLVSVCMCRLPDGRFVIGCAGGFRKKGAGRPIGRPAPRRSGSVRASTFQSPGRDGSARTHPCGRRDPSTHTANDDRRLLRAGRPLARWLSPGSSQPASG